LAGDDVGKLRQPPSPVTFNLAQRTTRQQTTVDAGALAHEVALPFFELFLNPSDLIDHLLEKDLPGFWEALAFDYVLCFGNRQLGLALLRRRLSGDGALQARFAELLPNFQTKQWRQFAAEQRASGLWLGGHQEQAGRLAQIAAVYQLDFE
jgi:hypothetical protein